MTAILGIDPGVHGAIAVLDERGDLHEVVDMPSTPEANGRSATNAPLLAGILARTHARIAFCELVGARPTDAKVAAFAFGRARGVIEGCAGALGLPIVFLTPPTWKRVADIPPGADQKDLARTRAIARRAVAEAKSFDEVKDIRDKAEALRAYARQAKNKQLEIDASEIRFRAERRVGEMMAEQRETVGVARPSGSNQHQERVAPKPVPTLLDAGIDKNLADRARKYAAIPERKFEAILAERRERIEQENARVTVNLTTEAMRVGRRERVMSKLKPRNTPKTPDNAALPEPVVSPRHQAKGRKLLARALLKKLNEDNCEQYGVSKIEIFRLREAARGGR